MTIFDDMYYKDNNDTVELEKQMIKNQIKISECNINDLELVYFSNENIDLINKQLILAVYKNSNKTYKINEQSPIALTIVMRYIFIEFSKNLLYDIKDQIKELNCRVINELVPKILTEVSQRVNYLNEISMPRKVLPYPINVHKTKNLKSISNIFM